MDTYTTVKQPASTELTIEHSRFIGHCLEATTEAAAKEFIAKIRSQHAQATHNCYAYRIGIGEHPVEYYNDHGEPSGTAGKPILGAIQRLNLTNVAVVVTRYFGGKKLGVRGLIEAYAAAASLVLEQAGVMIKTSMFTATLVYHYPQHAVILYRLQQLQAEVVTTQFTEIITTSFLIPKRNEPAFNQLLTELPVIKAAIAPE